MIDTIIFDFGNVFINLDYSATWREFSKLGNIKLNKELIETNNLYEAGQLSTKSFIECYQKALPQATKKQIIEGWNAILLDFPEYRLDFITDLASKKKYKLILLSNTNELHINWVKENIPFYTMFQSCFDTFYLSHEINLRKPNLDIFEFVLEQNQIDPNRTIFIDDTKENTDAASKLGIHTWNNNPKTEDIINLFTLKSDLF